ncbi:hypothetical protein TSAR_015378 [Trichomalopsis sarcophagae]|uniref:Mff-like domain-containing protein n=1 Tax=Trichomalopsis sarcophagae TaxID=543379 RepID=A0A232FC97_9HYME|nr:hypothetical protein TSAR_015378 [Trichomalopsis sarcophagae]
MANAHSPTRFNGEADNFFDPNYTLDINKRMRVPKSIRVSGDYTDEDIHNGTNGSAWNIMPEKFDMHVPDRILVVGQEQHIGTKAPPREIAIENAVLPSEPPIIRCITPPRVLTLDAHYFPTVDEDRQNNTEAEVVPTKPRDPFNNETQAIARHVREQTPAYNILDQSLPPGEEVQHLRRQVGKLNRRMMAIESEIQQQQQRMKLIYVMTAMYICFKTIFWFGKN